MSEPLLPTSDTAAQPARASKLLTVCPFILGNEFCERLAFYGLATNLSIYLTKVMGLGAGEASIQVSLFEGTCYSTPLLGAWLADSHWGRYQTIMVFSVIYAVGMFMMASTALVPGLSPREGEVSTDLQLALFYISLYVVAVGTGGIKPNVSAFGADQFDDKIKQDRKDKQSFFNWFYFSINIGSLIACTLIVWIQSKDWGTGFAIPAVAMALAVILFTAGRHKYTHQDPTGSPIERVVTLTCGAAGYYLRKICSRSAPSPHRPPPLEEVRVFQAEPPEVPLFANALRDAQQEEAVDDGLAWAGRRKGLSANKVEEVRMVLRMTPVFLLTILYWTIYTQMSSVFVIQGQYMDRVVRFPGGRVFEIPSASMTMFDTLSIIVLIPIYDGIFTPIMKRLGYAFTMLQRMGWGFLVASLAMVAAGLLERRRIAALAHDSNVSILEQGSQYLLVGLSEVLASIGQMEFFYDQAPDVMRSCCMALQLLSTALGGYLSAFLMAFVDRYTTWLSDLDHGSRLDLYFFLLAFIMLLNTLAFVLVASNYKYKRVKHRAPVPLIGGQRPHLMEWQRVGGVHLRPSTSSGTPASQAIDIGPPGYGYQYVGGTPTESTPDVGPYGRSVTYMPSTPIMPPNFR